MCRYDPVLCRRALAIAITAIVGLGSVTMIGGDHVAADDAPSDTSATTTVPSTVLTAAVEPVTPTETTPPTPPSAPVSPPTTQIATVPATTPESAPETTAPAVVPAPAATVLPAPAAVGPPAPAAVGVTVYPGQLGHILATIRYMESRGNYTVGPNRGNASGAYQFIQSTWNGYGGYSHAYLAPSWIQDERAALDVNRFLAQWNNDVSMIPVMWYYPRAATTPALMDVVPVPSAGNILTIREYQQRWLAVFSFISGKPIPAPMTQADVYARAGLPPTVPPPAAVIVDPSADAAADPALDPAADPAAAAVPTPPRAAVTFPVLGPSRVAAPDCEQPDAAAAGLCSPTAPGIVFGVKLQPVLAVHDGVVTAVADTPGAPIAVTVTDVTGRSYTLSGFNDDNPGTNDGAAPAHLRLTSLAKVGGSVKAGQILGFMGDSDPLPLDVRADVPTDRTIQLTTDQVAPHIRLTVAELDGTPLDAYGPVIDALFRQACSVAIGPWIVPANGSGHDVITIETTDTDHEIDSEWVITSTGQVTAAGWAAMIFPNEGCTFAPPDPHGPGAAGFASVSLDWITPIDLPTSIWVQLAVRDEPAHSAPLLPVSALRGL
jgi:hypothetical protein